MNGRLGVGDLGILDQVADEMIARNEGASAIWGQGFKLALQEIREVRAVIDSPRVDEFFAAVRNEAAHQVKRWGAEHDAAKRSEDWIALFVYLLGKATTAHFADDRAKLEHHVITVAAVALNWHRAMFQPEARCSFGWSGPADRADDHDCDLEDPDAPPPPVDTALDFDGNCIGCGRRFVVGDAVRRYLDGSVCGDGCPEKVGAL